MVMQLLHHLLDKSDFARKGLEAAASAVVFRFVHTVLTSTTSNYRQSMREPTENTPLRSRSLQDTVSTEATVQDGLHPSQCSRSNLREEATAQDDEAKEESTIDSNVGFVVAAVTLTSFLVMLDMSILPTVAGNIITCSCCVLC
jgi:hypothetical protein